MTRRTLPVAFTLALSVAALGVAPGQPAAQTRFQSPPAESFPMGQAGWISDGSTGCRIWSISLQPGLSVSWSGGCEGGIASGEGVLQWSFSGRPTERYEGTMREGRPHGRGSYSWPDGEWYLGEYLAGRRHGRGFYFFRSRSIYAGEFVEDSRTGHGVAVLPDGSRYEGEWRGGRRFGRGTLTYPDGRRVVADWRDDRVLRGSMVALDPESSPRPTDDRPADIWPLPSTMQTDPAGNCQVWNGAPIPQESVNWTGNCANGLAQGQGVVQWTQAGRPTLRMEGQFRDGRANGQVTLEGDSASPYAGIHYEGLMRNGRPHGQGMLVIGRVRLTGNWVDGCLRRGRDTVGFFGRIEGDCDAAPPPPQRRRTPRPRQQPSGG